MRNKIVGIDLGAKGAIVIRHGEEVETIVMPLADGSIDAFAIRELFLEIASEVKAVYLEKVFAGPLTSKSSMLSFGIGVGKIQGILIALGIPFHEVIPQRWQKALFGAATGLTTKDKALKVAQRLFPHVELKASQRSTKPHDGIVDALLISEYGIRLQGLPA